MPKSRQRNSKYLNGLVNKISKKIKNEEITTQAKKVSNLYNEGYIVNTTTAQNILLKMLAGVSYKKEYDKVIPKAETHKEIKQPPNIGIRKRRAHNKTPKPPQPKPQQPPKPQQQPGSLTRNLVGYEMDENKAFALSEEERFYKIQYNKRKDDEGGPSEKYILKVILYNFYNDKNAAHRKLKSKYGKEAYDPPTGQMKRYKYVQRFIIVYIEVKCYEQNFKYGSDQNLLQRYHNKMLERELLEEEIDYEMLYGMLLTNPKSNSFDD